MVSIDWLINPIIQNWVTILITSLVTLLAAVLSNYGIKKRFKSAKDKERQQALEELRSAIEDLIINNRNKITDGDVGLDALGLSSDRIQDLIDAAEREHQVSLSEATTPVTLLQDVDLRIKNSRYLDPDQKYQYSCAITRIIDEVQDDSHSIVLPEKSAELLERIETEAEYPGAKDDIEKLRKNIYISESPYSNSDYPEVLVRISVVLTTILFTAILIPLFIIRDESASSFPEIGVIAISVMTLVFIFILTIEAFDDDKEIGGILAILLE